MPIKWYITFVVSDKRSSFSNALKSNQFNEKRKLSFVCLVLKHFKKRSIVKDNLLINEQCIL